MAAARARSAIDPDFSPEVVADLYRFRPRSLALTLPLAVLLGPLGAHRFYLGFFWTGALMLVSLGGGLIWWIVDLWRLRRLVDDSNALEQKREDNGLPPRGMGFMPPRGDLRLDARPIWAQRRAGPKRAIGSAVLLAILGFVLGRVSRTLEFYEPAVVLSLFVLVSLVASRVTGLRSIPVLNALVRWVHRLRLFYHTVDPGGVWTVVSRPVLGILVAPWRPRIRAEIRLHLQMGGFVVLLFSALDVLELMRGGGFLAGVVHLVTQVFQTLICTYLLVAPATALITTQLLLEARDVVIWALSAAVLVTLAVGLFAS